MEKIYKIKENLYIGSYRAAKKLKKLKKEGIKAIVNLMEKKKYDPRLEFVYLYKPLKDRTYIPSEDLHEILTFINDNIKIGKVLVHCNSGISRSGGIIVAILLIENPNWTWDEARKYVRRFSKISPHLKIKESILDYLELKKNNLNEVLD